MFPTKRIAAMTAATAISLASFGAPAMAASSSSKHWTKAQCQSWEKSFVKRNSKASSKRKAEGNKVLKSKGCKLTVK